jgi:hypothetical protein
MDGGREPTDWLALCTHHFLRTAMRAARTNDLRQLLLQQASRGFLPVPISATPTNHYASAFAELLGKFFDELTRFVRNGIELPPDAASDERVMEFGHLYFRLLGGIFEISSKLEEESLRAQLAASGSLRPTQSVIHLRGDTDKTASVELSLENTQGERTTVACFASDVRRADGIGPAFAPKFLFHPETLALDPVQEASVRISLTLDRDLYEPGAIYVGVVNVTREGECALQIPVQINSNAVEPHSNER